MNKLLFLGMASRSVDLNGPPTSVGEELRSTVVAGVMFTKVYQEACRLAGIKEPEAGYRTVLNRVKSEGHAQVACKKDRSAQVVFTIIRRL
jgi:hypothetical protein